MAVEVKLGSGPVLTITDWQVPQGSVVREFPELAALPEAAADATFFKVDHAALQPDQSKALKSGRASLNFKEGAADRWLQVQPHPNRLSANQGWMVVVMTTDDFLKSRRFAAAPHALIKGLPAQYPVPTQPQGSPPQPTALNNAVDSFKAALNRFVGNYPNSPLNVRDRLLRNPGEIWTAVDAGLDLIDELDADDQRRVQFAKEALERLKSDKQRLQAPDVAELPFDKCMFALDQLHGAWLQFVGLLSSRLRDAAAGTPEPDYSIVVEQLKHQLQSFWNASRGATTNNDVVGALLEEHIRGLIERWVRPLTVSSGGIAGLPTDYQIDGIVWDHNYLPQLVEEGSVAVVHPASVRGIFEIKASTESVSDFAYRLLSMSALTSGYVEGKNLGIEPPPVLGILLWDSAEYSSIRARSIGHMTCLFRDPGNNQPLQFNPGAIGDILTFVYRGVLRNT